MLAIPQTVRSNSLRILEAREGKLVTSLNFSSIGGGSINNCGKLATSSGNFFIKWNDAHRFPGMFEAEASGLKLLKQSGTIHIPEVVGWFEASDLQGIILEFIESKSRSSDYWRTLGFQLAALHQKSQVDFGLDRPNYIGSLQQFNTPKKLWLDFFIEQRLDIQVKLAADNHLLEPDIIKNFHTLYVKLPSLLPWDKPSLLHGDLWSGNVIVDENGEPSLIDPAIYYGHREAEISFTHLFGGFSDEFYDAYDKAFPLSPGFNERIDIYNLYPLLVHVNLFGGGYIGQVKSILKSLV